MPHTLPLTPCQPHEGFVNEQGYGMVGSKLAHRVAWEAEYGPIEPGGTLDHMCHDPDVCKLGKKCPHRRCKALDHLAVASAEENRERAGRYNRDKERCPEGHRYDGDNLLISGGKRMCRKCRREKLRERRAVQKVERCRASGHERDERVGQDGRAYCAVCLAENARKGAPVRHPAPKGRDKAKRAVAYSEWHLRKSREACAAKGHERVEVVGPSGRRFCAVCASAPKSKR